MVVPDSHRQTQPSSGLELETDSKGHGQPADAYRLRLQNFYPPSPTNFATMTRLRGKEDGRKLKK